MIRSGRLLLGITSILVWIVVTATPVRADRKEDAHASEATASRAFAKADYQTALDAYALSYGKYPKPYLLARMADCQRLLGRLADALGNYQQFVAKVQHGAERKKAVQWIAELEPQVAAAAAAAAEVPVEAAPAPQQNDTEAPPMSAEQLAKEERARKAHPETVSVLGPHADEPMPPGFDPANLVPDPTDPKIAPPPAHVRPPGYKAPWYQRWWPWTIVGAGVAVGVVIGVGVVYGTPKFSSELPIGGPGATHALSVRF